MALLENDIPGLIEYGNVPKSVGAVVSSGKATLYECETVYSVEDLYLMLEIIVIDSHNRRVAEEWQRNRTPR